MSQAVMPLLILGGVFFILGLAAMLWGRAEQRGYDSALSSRRDVREYLEHWPPRMEPKALIVGGWILLILGIAGLVVGFILSRIQS